MGGFSGLKGLIDELTD